MRKLRDDSTWLQLMPVQRETLESWLFDENLGYEKTLERVEKEFGLEATVASLGRYYRRRARERQLLEMLRAETIALEISAFPVHEEDMRKAVMKHVGKAALNLAIEKPDDSQQLASLAKLLLDSEENDLRRARLKLAEKCYNLADFAAAQKDFPHIKAYLKTVVAESGMTREEKANRFGEALFGTAWMKSKSEQTNSENGSDYTI